MDLVSILVIEDHPFLRLGLHVAFQAETHFRIVDELADMETARAWVAQGRRADVVLLDRGLPDGDGLQLVPMLKAAGMKVIILTIEDGGREIREAIEYDVDGYLLKTAESEEVINAICIVLKDVKAFPFHVLHRLNRVIADDSLDMLSSRELEIAGLVAQGLSNKNIAARLDLAENTIRNHLANIMHKLKLHSRVQLAALVLQDLKKRKRT